MPDFNSDRDGHADHMWVVQKAWADYGTLGAEGGNQIATSSLDNPVVTGKGHLKPDEYGRFTTHDKALADEIRAQYPKDYVVTRVRASHPSDRGHKYVFTVPELPWKRDGGAKEIEEDGKAKDSSERHVHRDEQHGADSTPGE